MTEKGKKILDNCFEARLDELDAILERSKTNPTINVKGAEGEIKSIKALQEINKTFGLTVA